MEEYILPEEFMSQSAAPRVRKRGLGTGRLWYAALVPLFGVYIELYADSFILGALVWVLALIMGPAACLLDLRYIRSKGVSDPSLKPFYALLPPLYILKRTKITGDSPMCVIVWCIMTVYALIMNGFTSSLMMTDEEIYSAVSESSWSSVSETGDVDCSLTIGESLKEIAGCEITWSGSRAKGALYAKCTGENGFAAEFHLDYDGYAVGEFHLDSLTIDGKTLTAAEAADLIREKYPSEDSSGETDTNEEQTAA